MRTFCDGLNSTKESSSLVFWLLCTSRFFADM
jgi:hypothetical protein